MWTSRYPLRQGYDSLVNERDETVWRSLRPSIPLNAEDVPEHRVLRRCPPDQHSSDKCGVREGSDSGNPSGSGSPESRLPSIGAAPKDQ